jgi:hypothetical protein
VKSKQSAVADLLPAIDAVFGGQRFISSSLNYSEIAPAPND